MSIASVQSVDNTQQQTNSSNQSLGTQTLGKDDFLKLLVAQMQNQNPMEQTDDKEFIAQLAQFSSVEQLTSIQSEMQSLVSTMQAMSLREQLTSGSSLIGKQVSGTLPGSEQSVSGVVTGVSFDSSGQVILEPLGIPIDYIDQINKGE